MDTKAPISSLMSTRLYTVEASDSMQSVKDIIDQHQVHHVPVLDADQLVGIVSDDDLKHFLKLTDKDSQEPYINELRLKNYKVNEVMTKELVTLSSEDSLDQALQHFVKNEFHAIPLVDNGILVGIITTHDIIKAVLG